MSKISKPLNTTQKNKLEKVFNKMLDDKERELRLKLDDNIKKEKEKYLKSSKVQKFLKQISKLRKEGKKMSVCFGYFIDTVIYTHVKNSASTPNVEKAYKEKDLRLKQFREERDKIIVGLWAGENTYEEMKAMIDNIKL